MENKMRIYISDVSALDREEIYSAVYDTIWEERRYKTDRLRNLSDKKLCIGAGLLLRYALTEYGCEPDGCEFLTDRNGKPFLKDSNIFFNLSHSGEKIMCITGYYPCGCDVEKIGRDGEKIAERFFSNEENELLNGTANEEEYADLFYRLWTLKESFIKCTGEGLSRNLASFSVYFEEGKPIIRGQKKKYSIGEISADDGYKYSFCIESDITTETQFAGVVSDGITEIKKYVIK